MWRVRLLSSQATWSTNSHRGYVCWIYEHANVFTRRENVATQGSGHALFSLTINLYVQRDTVQV